MQEVNLVLLPLAIGSLVGLLALGTGIYFARRTVESARARGERLVADASQDAKNKRKEILVSAHEKALGLEEEADRRDRELEDRETQLEGRLREIEREAEDLKRQRKQLDRRTADVERLETAAREAEAATTRAEQSATQNLERVAGLTTEQARAELTSRIESTARADAAKIARKILDEGRQKAEAEATNLMVQAAQRVNIRDVMESTVSFIELPNDEMKGRIIGKEGRNIRSLEMATGIDLIVDDTPRSIWISSFDPVRREIARVAIDRLLVDGRIHPARIEEVVERVSEEIDTLIEDKGNEAAFSLGLTDLHPKLLRLVGNMRYHTSHGQNLLQHSLETAMIAGFMVQELGGRVETVRRAGLLHEIGQVGGNSTGHAIMASAELCSKYQESEEVVQAIRSMHSDVQATTVEALLLITANKLSDSRPGARKENLAVFIERLKRLEAIATGFSGVQKAYAVKAGKELRILVDAKRISDEEAYSLSKKIARAVERDLSYPGQIKVHVVRETRAVRFAV